MALERVRGCETTPVARRGSQPRTREDVERLCTPCDCPKGTRSGKRREDGTERCWHLPEVLADLVRFLFFSAWRVNEVRSLEWWNYFPRDGMIRLRPELSKNKRDRQLPVDRGELAAIVARRLAARREHPECPYSFHRNGAKVGDFRKAWASTCAAVRLAAGSCTISAGRV